jgi:hypothetical protein
MLSTNSQIFPRSNNRYLHFFNSHLFYINVASKLDTVDEAINNDEKVVEVPPRKLKKAEKKAVTGESSMAPLHQERHGPCQDAHAFIQAGSRLQREKAPGRNVTCSATSPTAAEKPHPIPVLWDGPDARHEGFAYDDPPQVHFSQDFDPHQDFESYYRDQRYENATVLYGNHPSGPFMSNLSVTLASTRRQLSSLQDIVRQVSFHF